MTATVLFATDYAHSQNPWGYQAPPGKIMRGVEPDGRAYQRHECTPGVNWNGMQRADAIQNTPTSLTEGTEIAFAWAQMLEPGFYAPNPGWCVVGPEIHDSRGSTQSPLELNTSEHAVQARCFGGQISAIPPGQPVNGADKFYSQAFPFPIGVYHECRLGLLLSGDRTKGWIKYQVDGKLLLSQSCATLYSGGTGYLKLAFYRDPNQAGNRDAAVRFGNMTVWTGSGSWEAATGTPTPPPISEPIHDAVDAYGVSLDTADLLHALHLIADKVEP